MKLRHSAALIVALSLVIVTALSRTGVFTMYEDKTVDSRFRWRHAMLGPAPDPDIRIVGIDDQTITALGGRWPIAWQWHALLLDALSDKLPAVVAYAILLPSSEGQEKRDEERLVSATAKLGDLVYPYYFDLDDGEKNSSSLIKPPGAAEEDAKLLQKFALTDVEGSPDQLPKTVEVTLPIIPLAERAALGSANAQGDAEDGVVRRMPIVLGYKGKIYPSFVLMTALRYYNIDLEDVHVLLGEMVEFDIPEGPHISIPIDAHGDMIINYTALNNEFPHSVFIQVVQSLARQQQGLHAPLDLADFEDKLVLVGVTATGVIESYMKPTPLAPESPILTAYANALSTILSGTFPGVPGPYSTLLLLLLIGVIVAVITASLRAATSLLISVLCLCAFCALSYLLFFTSMLLIPMVSGSLMVVFVFTLITSYRYATEERQRKFYRGVLGKYLSRNVMESILRNPGELKLGGARKELTVLFTDIKGFTKFCEKRTPEEVPLRLNELHDKMTQVVWKYDGTLNKYMGDGMMAFWGAPLPQEDHAQRAVLAAIEMTEELKRLHESWEMRGVECLSLGIGVNTGPMIVGNMGSTDFWDYTVLGDDVNLASRLEGLTRTYGVNVILSEFTYRLVSDIVEARLIGEVTVKGKEKPVVIYELVGRKPPR
ncbi:MAG: adenylate/guanylate cyclase domain-containing protein [Candidatus Aureabacteria bacterium]|nr:adenylate/guanylate cyclase domain-containing protein [Candidatus Auribacterota bacterium]